MILFVSGEQWMQGRGQVSPFPQLDKPALLVWQPAGAADGVYSFEGNPRHAAALIHRKLKNEGAMEGEIKVLVDRVERLGSSCIALYTAVPLGQWHRMLAWARAQRHHCLLYTANSLLARASSAQTAVVLQDDTRFTFIGVINARLVHMHAMSLGSGHGEAAFALTSLGERVGDEVRASRVDAQPAPALDWFCMSASDKPMQPDTPSMQTVFANASGLALAPAQEDEALWRLARHATPLQSLNPPADQWAAWASSTLSICTALSLTAAAGFTALGATRLMQSVALDGKTQTLVRAQEPRDRALPQPAALPANLGNQLALVETLQQAQGAGSLPALLAALKTAGGADIRILGVRLEDPPAARDVTTRTQIRDTRTATGNFIVDGMLADSTAGTGSLAIAGFVRALREAGYVAEAMEAPATAEASSRLIAYRLKPSSPPTEPRP